MDRNAGDTEAVGSEWVEVLEADLVLALDSLQQNSLWFYAPGASGRQVFSARNSWGQGGMNGSHSVMMTGWRRAGASVGGELGGG